MPRLTLAKVFVILGIVLCSVMFFGVAPAFWIGLQGRQTVSEFSLVSRGVARNAQHPTNRKIRIPLLWTSLLFVTASVMLALPAIKDGVFDALSTDDAMRLVEVN